MAANNWSVVAIEARELTSDRTRVVVNRFQFKGFFYCCFQLYVPVF